MATTTTIPGIATPATRITLRRLAFADLSAALAAGWRDFRAAPTQLVFLCVLYPLVGLVAARAALHEPLLPLLWPMVAGLSLMGPICAVGLYAISRRREAGEAASAAHAFDVLKSPALPQLVVMAGILAGLFIAWLVAARTIHALTLGPLGITGIGALLHATFTTREGLWLLLAGNLVGLGFAAVVLVIGTFSVPLLLDRHVSLPAAIGVSVRLARENRPAMIGWGLLVAATLVAGALPLFIGLAVAMPVLGHATWHLYRRAVVP